MFPVCALSGADWPAFSSLTYFAMNKIHRTVWNATLGAYVAAPETARGRGKGGVAAGAALATLLLAGAAHAQTTLNTVDTGWYTNLGQHNVGNTNYITGNLSGAVYRSYFVFDIGSSALAPDQIFSGATLNVNAANVTGLPASGAAFQAVLYGGDANALGNVTPSTEIFGALGNGTLAGSLGVSSATASNSTLSVQLNAAAVSALTAAAGQRIAFGGSLTGISEASSYVGGSSNFGMPQTLSYTVTTLAAGQYHWDLDGSTAGAGGASPSGIWGRTNAERFWNADSGGVGPTVAWINGSTANFAAGNDATGDFTVTLGDNVTVNGIGYRGANGSLLRIEAGTGFGIATTAGDNIVDVTTAGATLDLVAAVSGPGALVKDGLGTLVLSNANTYGGTTTINVGTLQVGNGGTTGTLGAGAVTNNAALVFNRSDNISATNAIDGSGSVTQNGTGTLTLTGSNTYTGGTTVATGELIAAVTGALGSGPVNVASSATLGFRGTAEAGNQAITTGARDNALGLNGGFVQFRDDSSAGQAQISAANGAIIEFRDRATAGLSTIDNAGGVAFYETSLAAEARIINRSGGDTTFFDNSSAGKATITNESGGRLDLFDASTAAQATVINNAGGRVFISGTNAGTNIGSLSGAGDVILGARALTTGGLNTDTTIGGTISGLGGSLVKEGTGTLGLSASNTYSGGTTLNSGTLAVTNDSALGTGALTINGGTLSGDANLSNAFTVNADFSSAGSLAFTGGVTLNGPTRITAVATPGYSLSALYFDSAIGGAGGLTLESSLAPYGATQVVFSGAASNTYSGGTTVGGTQLLVLQKTGGATAIPGDLTIEGNAIVATVGGEQIASTSTVTVNSVGQVATTINGVPVSLEGLVLATWAGGPITQTFAALNGSGTVSLSDATLRLGAGNFSGILSNGSYADAIAAQGGPSSNGKLEKFGPGILTLSGANTYTGGTVLKGGTLAVGNDSALGTGGLAMDDNTTLAFAADGLTIANPITMTGTNDPTFDTGTYTATLTGGIAGAAELTKTGSGTLVFGAANNTYSGSTTVAQGTLRAGVANAFSAASATNVSAGATLDTAGFNQTVAALTNAGTVSLLGSTAGSTLTVNGNYVGNNGLLVLGTALGGNASATDRLVVTGSASGATAVQVTNLSGLGAQTTGDGIEIIRAAGGIASNAFSLAGTVSAGAYDYRLNTTGTAAYLSNTIAITPVDPTPPDSPAPPAGPSIPMYRAEASLYAALPEQLRESNLAMLGNVHQRTGDDGVAVANAAGTAQGLRQAWGRVITTERTIAQTGTVSPTSQGRLNGFQAGTDLWATTDWRTGVYVGQLDGDMSVNGFARGITGFAAGSNDLRSQYLGAYATWKNGSGLYLDGVLQAGRHRVSVNPALAAGQSVKGDSLLASIEAGQAFNIAPNWTLEPQLQLVHQRVSLDDASIVGARVQQDSHNGWTVRAGLRVKGQIETGSGTLQPYARVNLYKRGSGTDITRFSTLVSLTDIATRTGGTSSELTAGATWQLSQRTSVYGEVGKLWASGGNARTKSSVSGSVGVKVRW